MTVKTITDYERAEELLAGCYSGPCFNESDALSLLEELIRFRDREPLVQRLVAAVDRIDPFDGKGLGLASALCTEIEEFSISPSAAGADGS